MQRWVADASDEEQTGSDLGSALGVEGFALRRYRLPPGTGLPSGLHAHLDQEEVFVVLSGDLLFETLDGHIRVDADDCIRFAPGEYQSGRNASAAPTVVLAAGAPRESNTVLVPLECPGCGAFGLNPSWDAAQDEVVLACPDCDADHRTAGCPACEREELRVAADEDGNPFVRCPACGAERDHPLYR